MPDEPREHQHIEALPVPDFEDEPRSDLVPQPHGGALQRGNMKHGAGFRGSITPALQRKAAQVREDLEAEFPGISQLSLPTVELLCQDMARAILLNNFIMEFVEGGKTRSTKGGKLSGVEAVPPYIWAEASRASDSAAKRAQDLGLDLTGRVKALKDDAIRASLNGGGSLNSFAADGRKLRQLRGRGA